MGPWVGPRRRQRRARLSTAPLTGTARWGTALLSDTLSAAPPLAMPRGRKYAALGVAEVEMGPVATASTAAGVSLQGKLENASPDHRSGLEVWLLLSRSLRLI